MNRLFIGITGNMGAGKTTLANAIERNYPEVEVRPFAEKVKEIARMMGWNGQKDDKGRRLLQLIGTECGRDCLGDDIWVRHWLSSLSDSEGWPMIVVADDVRFANEAAAIRSLGGIIVRVDRPGYCGNGHASETQAVEADMTTRNVATVADLEDRASTVVGFAETVRRSKP